MGILLVAYYCLLLVGRPCGLASFALTESKWIFFPLVKIGGHYYLAVCYDLVLRSIVSLQVPSSSLTPHLFIIYFDNQTHPSLSPP